MDDNLREFLLKRDKWIQTAVVSLVSKKNLTLDSLADLCIKEANNLECNDYELINTDQSALGQNEKSIAINKISHPVSINALDENYSLDFLAEGLSIIYGENGSGKSSYVRALKKVCGQDVTILPNIFNGTPSDQAIDITYTIGDHAPETKTHSFKDPTESKLKRVSIFDGEVVSEYLDQKTQAAADPFEIRFLKELIEVMDDVKKNLKKKQNSISSTIVTLPPEFKETDSAKTYSSLNHKTEYNEVLSKIKFSSSDEKRKEELSDNLAKNNPEVFLKHLRKNEDELKKLSEYWGKICRAITNEHLKKIYHSFEKSKSKRQVADEGAAEIFQESKLAGVGSKTWKSMWNAAKKYSEEKAYTDKEFPDFLPNKDVCLLCHQTIDNNAANRLDKFQEFIVGTLESDATEAEKEYEELKTAMPIPNDEQVFSEKFSIFEDLNTRISEIYLKLEKLIEEVEGTKNQDILPVYDFEDITKVIGDSIKETAISILEHEKLLDTEQRKKLEKELLELSAKKWVYSQKEAIELEIKYLVEKNSLDKALGKTNTSAITSRINKISQTKLVANYQKKFSSELSKLRASHISISPVSKPLGKGKVAFKLELSGTKISHENKNVLSDGERRVISLASFLSDMSLKDSQSTLIFDDPISSLDQSYEEAVVERLIEISKVRQVIVFTHRLSLLTLLREAVKSHRKDSENMGTEPETNYKAIMLRKLGENAGIVTPARIFESSLKSAFSNLLERCDHLKKVDQAKEYLDYQNGLKSICSDFRIIVERCVEEKLLDKVVLRFRRSIVTKDKLKRLTRIGNDDVDLIEGLMTKYSAFEHSQAVDTPIGTIDLVNLRTDIESLKEWEKQYLKN